MILRCTRRPIQDLILMPAVKPCPHKYENFMEDVVNKGFPFFVTNITINSLVCLSATVINGLIILVISRTRKLRRNPSYLLYFSLCITDFVVGLVVQPIYVISRFAELKGFFHTFCSTWLASRLLAGWLINASLGSITAISIDRVLAVHLGQRYRSVVTIKRVAIAIISVWLMGAFVSSIRLFADVRVYLGVGSGLYAACLFVASASYWKTSRMITRSHQTVNDSLSGQNSSQEKSSLIRYQKSLKTMLYVVCLVLLCYLPYICLSLPVVFTGRSVGERAAWTIIDTLILLNSSLNPFVYCWRTKPVRRAVMGYIRSAFSKIFCC